MCCGEPAVLDRPTETHLSGFARRTTRDRGSRESSVGSDLASGTERSSSPALSRDGSSLTVCDPELAFSDALRVPEIAGRYRAQQERADRASAAERDGYPRFASPAVDPTGTVYRDSPRSTERRPRISESARADFKRYFTPPDASVGAFMRPPTLTVAARD